MRILSGGHVRLVAPPAPPTYPGTHARARWARCVLNVLDDSARVERNLICALTT